MIKDEQQRTAVTRGKGNNRAKGVNDSSHVQVRQNFLRRTLRVSTRQDTKPVRQNVSQKVIDAAERMMKEYEADLEYLKDK